MSSRFQDTTLEEIRAKIPFTPWPDYLPYCDPHEVGCGVFRYMVRQRQVYDYRAYQKTLEDNGFECIGSIEKPEGRGVITSSYKKGNAIVGLNYNFFWRMICATYQLSDVVPPYTCDELYAAIPDLPGAGVVEDYGDGNYVRFAKNTVKTDYLAYRKTLEDAGFRLYAANEEGFGDSVFNALYLKDDISVSVTFVARVGNTYVSAAKGKDIPATLLYNAEDVAANPEGAKTTLHMVELYLFGSCFLFRLKNGHFIVQDGGTPHEIGYFLDYLESLAGGEKPIIDAWFVTHPHRDHTGVLCRLTELPEMCDRIRVNGLYFNEPCGTTMDFDSASRADAAFMHRVCTCLKTTDGTDVPLYRPHTGERYYFNDISVDIIMSQEQLLTEKATGDINDCSTWCLFNVEGQKALLGGDGDLGGMDFIMDAYPGSYLDSEVFTALHHCHNTTDKFTDYFKKRTILVPCKVPPQMHPAENEHLRQSGEEWFLAGDGTCVLTFPYTVGETERKEHFTWKYHDDEGNMLI